MADYTKLKEFAERIKAKGIPEQQYIAQGILELLSEAAVNKDAEERKSENEKRGEEPVREGLDREDLSGCIVEEANGDRWVVEGWVYEAKTILDDLDHEIGLMSVRRTFTQEELEKGMFKVIGGRV